MKKDWVYIFPLLILFSVITGIGIHKIKPPLFLYIIIFLIFIGGLLYNFLIFSRYRFLEKFIFTDTFSIFKEKNYPNLMLNKYIPYSYNFSYYLDESLLFIKESLRKEEDFHKKTLIIIKVNSHPVRHALTFLLRINFPYNDINNDFWEEDRILNFSLKYDSVYFITDENLNDNKYILKYADKKTQLNIYKNDNFRYQ